MKPRDLGKNTGSVLQSHQFGASALPIVGDRFSRIRRSARRFSKGGSGSGLKVLLPQIIAVLLILVASKAGAGVAIFPLLALWALRGHRQAIEAFSLAFLVTYLNPVLFPSIDAGGTLRWLTFGCASLRIFYDAWRWKTQLPKPIWYLWLFSGFAVVSSLLASPLPILSISKIVTFTMGVSAALLAARLSTKETAYWKSWFFTVFLTVLILSIPTFFVSSIGRANNERGFQGILNQPQAFGVFLCPLVAWLTASYLLHEYRSRTVVFALILGGAGIFLSLARISLVAIILGFFISIIAMEFVKPKALHRAFATLTRRKSTVMKLLGAACILLVVVTLNWSSIEQSAYDFINKGEASTTLAGHFEESRGFLVEKSMANFYAAPWFGIGFGVPSDFQAGSLSSSTLGIITSSPTEKGFLPSATLEENGLVGTVLLLIFLFSLIRAIAVKGNFSMLWLFCTCLAVNAGEMIFFSTGGIGMYLWLLMGLAFITLPQSQPQPRKNRMNLR